MILPSYLHNWVDFSEKVKRRDDFHLSWQGRKQFSNLVNTSGKGYPIPSFSRSLTTITWILLSGSPFFLLAPSFFAPCTSKGPEWTQIPCLSQANQASTKTTVDCQPKHHCCNLLTPPPNQPNAEKKAQSHRRS